MSRSCILVVSILLVSAMTLRAEFVGNVEHFDGTTIDLSTWSEYRQYGNAVFTQNSALTISAVGDIGELRARLANIGVGGFVQVRATMIYEQPDSAPSHFLALNTMPPPEFNFTGSDRSAAVES